MIQKIQQQFKRWRFGQSPAAPTPPESPAVHTPESPVQAPTLRIDGRRIGAWGLVLASVVLAGWLWHRSPTAPQAVTWHIGGWRAAGVAVLVVLLSMWLWRTVFRLAHLALWLVVLTGLAWAYWHFYLGTPFPLITWGLQAVHFVAQILSS